MIKIVKFGVEIIKSSLFLENIMQLDGLVNVKRVVASQGTMSASTIFCGLEMWWKLPFAVSFNFSNYNA